MTFTIATWLIGPLILLLIFLCFAVYVGIAEGEMGVFAFMGIFALLVFVVSVCLSFYAHNRAVEACPTIEAPR